MRRFRSSTRPALPHQRGAAAIEFALVLPLFLLLFFGLVFFGVTLTLQHNLNHAAQIAARAGLAADPEKLGSDYEAKVKALAKAAAENALGWMSQDLKDDLEIASALTTVDDVSWLDVTVRLPKESHPLSSLAGFLSLDELTDLTGRAKLRL